MCAPGTLPGDTDSLVTVFTLTDRYSLLNSQRVGVLEGVTSETSCGWICSLLPLCSCPRASAVLPSVCACWFMWWLFLSSFISNQLVPGRQMIIIVIMLMLKTCSAHIQLHISLGDLRWYIVTINISTVTVSTRIQLHPCIGVIPSNTSTDIQNTL